MASNLFNGIKSIYVNNLTSVTAKMNEGIMCHASLALQYAHVYGTEKVKMEMERIEGRD